MPGSPLPSCRPRYQDRLIYTEIFESEWSWREESNPRPADYKSAALPTELRQRRDHKHDRVYEERDCPDISSRGQVMARKP